MQHFEPTAAKIAHEAADKIEKVFEAYETALKTLIRLTDDLSVAFETDTPEFKTLLKLGEGFDDHATQINSVAGTYEKLAAAAKIATPVVRT